MGDQTGPGISPELAVNKWIIGEVVTTLAELDKAMADLRFDAAANAIYHFVWDTFCDWYIELIKGSFDDETRAVAGWVLDQILVMLHPFMPFVTEELWASMGERENELIVAKWPEPGAAVDVPAKAEVDLTIKIIDGIRSQRLDVGFKASDIVPVSVLASSASALEIANRNVAAIRRIARVHPALIGITKGSGPDSWGVELRDTFTVNEVETTSFVAAQFPVGEITFLGFTQGFIDVAAEKARLTKALEASTKEARSLEGRLKNPAFVEKAKPEAVEKARADHAAHAAEAERLAAALARLG
jgi:valyl-tRNA synthetase